MRLKSITADAATEAWQAYKINMEFDAGSINIDTIGDDDDEISDWELESLVDSLRDVQTKFEGKTIKSVGGQIDSEIVEVVHSELSKLGNIHALCQIGFWRWLSNVAYNGYFWNFIMWRLNSDQVINWGITGPGSIIEVYFYRAWLRGHKMLDNNESDPYKYAKLGTSDVWRSHILRQDFGRDKEFVKAFLDAIYDANGNTIIGTKELREKVIPAIRAWTSGATFTHLSYKESQELIKKLRRDQN